MKHNEFQISMVLIIMVMVSIGVIDNHREQFCKGFSEDEVQIGQIEPCIESDSCIPLELYNAVCDYMQYFGGYGCV